MLLTDPFLFTVFHGIKIFLCKLHADLLQITDSCHRVQMKALAVVLCDFFRRALISREPLSGLAYPLIMAFLFG